MNKNRLRTAAIVIGFLGAGVATAATDWSAQDYDLYPGDFDGDGKTDLLYVAKDAAKSSGIARSDASAPNIPFQSWPSNYLGIPWSGNQYSVIVADFNGDLKSDLLLQRATAGDSYLLFADANGKITAISQMIANTALSLNWSLDQHRIMAGDFNNDGKADLFFQATRPTVTSGTAATNAVVFADANGQFTAGPAQTWTDASWSAFKWSTQNSNIFVGDFNGDGKKDLLVQARPKLVMIDYDVPIPVPTYPPNMNGVALSLGGVTPFQQVGVQQWSRIANGVDWSPLSATVIVGDLNGDGRADVLLQARTSSRPSHLLSGNASGAAFATGTALATNVTWSSDTFRLLAGNFDGTGGAGIYYQAVTSGGTNYYANVVTGATVTQTVHNPTAATGVLPTTAVGHTVGSFAVTDGGAATYSIPIVVPPGVAGMQPKLSIGYSSDGGNGLLGIGWGLGGLSAISRCGKTLAQDNSNDTVLLATSDSLCLDGNKLRLTSGTWGAVNSTYQTEMETFARVTAHGPAVNGATWFSVKTKDGATLEYGNTADSRIESLNTLIPNTPRVWALNKITDRAGNVMTFAYEEDGAPNGSFRPTTITYTANSGASLSAAYRVTFQSETRPATDAVVGYIAGAVVRETKRLTAIETQYNDPAVGNWRTVRKYRFSYNASGPTARSRLASVQECDKDSNCLAPTIISWKEPTYGWAATDSGSTAVPTSAGTGLPIDMNGDGRVDFAYFDTGTATWKVAFGNTDGTYTTPTNTSFGNATYHTLALPIDVNSDGRHDLIVPHTDNTWWWLRYNGSSFTASTTNVSFTPVTVANFTVADVTGDGRDDILYGSSPTIYLRTNQSSATTASFAAATAVWTTPSGEYLSDLAFGPPSAHFFSPLQVADFDGDGRADVLTATREDVCGGEPNCQADDLFRWRVLQSTGTALVLKLSILATNATQPNRPMVADINADGRQDLVYAAGSTSKTWRYRLGNGGSAASQLMQAEVDTGIQTGASGEGLISDCDGDGHTDLIDTWNGTRRCMRSNGEALTAGVDLGISGAFKVADMNGDSLLDFVYRDAAGNLKIRLHRGSVADMVSSIADGYGNSVTITYAPLTDPTVYTKCPVSPLCPTAAAFPVVDIQPAEHVVKSYTVSDGIGGSFAITEKYAGLRVHAQGRGLLGFASRESVDSRTGIKVTSTFRQDFPYIGLESQTTTYQPDGVSVISQTINTPAELLPVQGGTNQDRHFAYVQQSEQTSREVGGPSNTLQIARVTATQSIDAYGNVTNATTTTADLTGSGQTFTTANVNTYAAADTTNWCLGFITDQTVTKTVPGLAAQTRAVQYVKDTSNVPACRVYQEIVEPSDTTGDLKVTTTITYDAFGHPTSQVVSAANIQSRTTSTSFGTQGVFPMSATQSVSSTFNHTASKTFDFALGVPLTITDQNGLVTSFEYDGFGRMTKETRPDGTKTAFTYSACTVLNNYCGDSRLRYQVEKRELSSADVVIRTSRHLADALGRDLYVQGQALSGAFANIATNYDNLGRPFQESLPYFTGFPAHFTTISYDLLDRPTLQSRRISEADAGTQTIQYSYNRLTQSTTDANLKVTTKEVNAIGQVVKMTDAANGVTQYEYDQFGNLTKTKDPLNNQIVNTFNIRGFKLSTTDPDTGQWVYTYFPTSELRTQRDAKLKAVTFTYDHISRPLTRVEDEGTTTFTYGTSAAQKDIGQLQSVTAPGAYSESYVYDSKGRLQDATMNADAASFVVSQTYDSTTGLLDAVTYPTSTSAVPGSRFKVKYEYAYGMTKRVVDFNSPATVYWEEVATNAVGQSIDEVYGNGLHTYSTFDSISGLLGARTTGPTAAIQNLTFQWDKVGNLTQRKDLTLGLTEDFQYDNLYRLTSSTLNGVNNLSVAYDALGNITSKGGVGAYTYPASGASAVRPHAVTTAGSNAYTYDANGNMNARNGSTITWYSYNLPNRIDQGSSYSQFFYGASRARYKQVAVTAPGGSLPAGTETTMYVGGLYERVTKPSGVVEHKHYILAGKEAVALRTLRSNSINDTRYLHYDHLGSLSVVTNEAGAVVLQLSYDALGKRRGATAWSGAPAAGNWTSIAAITHRGFTFHEQLDNVDLIHMNGRVYDPNIGRFISADPFVQAPLMSQSLNRYSYVMNNPLSLVDPSGYSALSKFFKKLRRHLHAGLRFLVSPTPKNFFEMIKSSPGQDKIDRFILSHDWAYKAGYAIAVVSSFWIGGYGGAVYQAYYTYIVTGSTTQAVIAGIAAAAQQYATNYWSTGSGFSMQSGGSGVVVLSWDGTASVSGGGPGLGSLFMSAFLNAPPAPTADGAGSGRQSDKILNTQELLAVRKIVGDLQKRMAGVRNEAQFRQFDPGFYGSKESDTFGWQDAMKSLSVDVTLIRFRIEMTLAGTAPADAALSPIGSWVASKATGLKGIGMLAHTDRGIRYEFYYEIHPMKIEYWFVDRHSNIRYQFMRPIN